MKIKKILISAIVSIPCFVFGMDVVSNNYSGILNSHAETLTVWNVQDNPQVFVFDFAGLTSQGRTFNRITQFIEQAQSNSGYPRVLTTDELSRYMDSLKRTEANFAYGHDLLVSELVQFFNLSDRDKIDLYPEELRLRDFLLQQGLIKMWRNFYQAVQPGVVILSIPQTQLKKVDEPAVNELARRAIFTHEIAHGEYYTNQYYAAYCRKFWNETLNSEQKQAFIEFFKKYNYDVGSGELVVNEMQAYLMFTPDQNSFNAGKLGITDDELERMRTMFRKGNPPTKLRLH